MKNFSYFLFFILLLGAFLTNILYSKNFTGNNFSLSGLTNAFAQGNENGGSGTCTGYCGAYVPIPKCTWTATVVCFRTTESGKVKVYLGTQKVSCTNCAYNCDFEKKGTCTSPQFCPQGGEEYNKGDC